ncbi:hypothetical protein ACAG65_12785 [Halodesulfovibrio aestuarii]|uniref:hypothetical protein n=1 Tax=Halodesulfovibrio aestuarii TaxID=126333 RepID=UPI00351FC242
MPHMSETGILMMGVLLLAGFTLYSILAVLPCWIIATRRNVAGGWWNWLIPLRNFYVAYRLGNGSLKKAFLIIAFFAIGVGAVFFYEYSQVVVVVGSVSFLISSALGCYVLYCWLKQISILAGVHPQFLPVVMFIIPLLLALVGSSLVSLEIVPMRYIKFAENIISLFAWVVFMTVALRTPREDLEQTDFVFGKE